MTWLKTNIFGAVWIGILVPFSLWAQGQIIPVAVQQQCIRSLVERWYSHTAIRFQIEFSSGLRPWKVEAFVDSVGAEYRGPNRPKGHSVFILKAFRQGRLVRTRTVSARIRTYQVVWKLKRSLEREAAIRPEDVFPDTVETTGLQGEPLERLSTAPPWFARRYLRKGTILTHHLVHPGFLVRVGESVTLVLEQGPLRIRRQMRALQNGIRGDRIWLVDPQTRKRVKGRVVGRALAIVVP